MSLKKKVADISIKVIICVTVFYLAVIGLLYNYQNNLLFFPSPENPFLQSYEPYTPLHYTLSNGITLKGLWYPPEKNKPTIVYLHGNAGHIGHRLHKANLFRSHGYGVALIGYEGFDGNPGIPSEKNLYDDARAALSTIRENKKIADKNIILYGESLGTGVAIKIASEKPEIKAVILEASYTSIPDVASNIYWFIPVHLLIQNKFESYKRIGSLKMPLMIIHGTKDEVIPYDNGQKLFNLVTSNTKQFLTLKGAGHNNLYDYGAEEAVSQFINKIDSQSDNIPEKRKIKSGNAK